MDCHCNIFELLVICEIPYSILLLELSKLNHITKMIDKMNIDKLSVCKDFDPIIAENLIITCTLVYAMKLLYSFSFLHNPHLVVSLTFRSVEDFRNAAIS